MIVLNQLTKRFSAEKLAVDALSLSVSHGEVYGLLGPNGAGKTTTLRMLLGLLEPTSGNATIDEFSIKKNPEEVKRHIGLVSASAGLYQWLTPREVLEYFAMAYSLSPSQIRKRTQDLTEIMNLGEFLDQRCATLSTGQKQRVNLARALIHDPPVVLLDEPTRGLDVVGAHVIFDYVNTLREQKKAIIVCTHKLEEAERLCDRFGLLYHGQLRHEGTIDELRVSTGKSTLVDMFLELLIEDGVREAAV
ncbi:MAG TPA: sodium ABC transporter ATP-binding protein [Planctomycetaceae bacterium]|nr:sodium ABC transporter ATP-binding protein [Planctomycetaceae bacterium]